jgi:catechol 2,3-dioxygenase-like lactoylglutathione lyase family enzyme
VNYRSIAHIAVRVENLQKAESFYQAVFGLAVAFREARTEEGWATLPPDAGWAEVERSGLNLDLVFLRRDSFELALERTSNPVAEPSRLSHIALVVSQEELEALRGRARELGCPVGYDMPHTIMFGDPFGVRWEIMLTGQSRSTGERTGRWLRVKQP